MFLGIEMVFYFLANFLILEEKTEKKREKEYIPIGTTIGMVSIFEHTNWPIHLGFMSPHSTNLIELMHSNCIPKM